MHKDELFILEHLTNIFQLAHNDALVSTLEELASRAGISEIQGFPISEFFARRKREIAEHLVADFADTSPTLASRIKTAWEKVDREREVQCR